RLFQEKKRGTERSSAHTCRRTDHGMVTSPYGTRTTVGRCPRLEAKRGRAKIQYIKTLTTLLDRRMKICGEGT
ncbi:hypothetical protein NDU88_005523, partial [Pleurodeles waltl]